MKVLAKAGREDMAVVYLAEFEKGRILEFVESVQPPLPREKKWVLLISSLYGCPVGCKFCDADSDFKGKVSVKNLLAQIKYMVEKRFPDSKIACEKFKIQFARIGEPSFNGNVLKVLKLLPSIYRNGGLLPSVSTIAPASGKRFFEELLKIKKSLYPGNFQLQFSLHTTGEKKRDWLIPVKKWDFKKISGYGREFYDKGGRKITLNFAFSPGLEIKTEILKKYFSPDVFAIKITPVNPTSKAIENNLTASLNPAEKREKDIIAELREAGYQVILSVGNLEENRIGSNCGQYINNYKRKAVLGAYIYPVIKA